MEKQSRELPEDLETPATGEDPSAPGVPRMRIVHLMMWTLCTAVFLVLWQGIRALESEPRVNSGLLDASGVVYSILAGAMLTGMAVLVMFRIQQGPPLCQQPGHWVVVITSITYVLTLLAWTVSISMSSDIGWFAFLLHGLIELVESFGYTFAGWNSSRKRWKYLFAILALLLLVQALIQIGLWAQLFGLQFYQCYEYLMPLSVLEGVVFCVGILLVVFLDRREKLQRDWVHWTGISCFCTFYGLGVLWVFASSFL